MIKRIISAIVLMLSCINTYAQLGYQYGSEYIYLEPDRTMYFIQTKDVVSERTMEDTLSVRQQQKIVKSFDKISTNRFLVVSAEEAVANTLGYVSDVYRNPDQCKIVVLPRIVLSMKEGRMIDPILEKFYGKVSVEQKDGSRYILRCHLNHSKDVLDVIAMLNTLNEIE